MANWPPWARGDCFLIFRSIWSGFLRQAQQTLNSSVNAEHACGPILHSRILSWVSSATEKMCKVPKRSNWTLTGRLLSARQSAQLSFGPGQICLGIGAAPKTLQFLSNFSDLPVLRLERGGGVRIDPARFLAHCAGGGQLVVDVSRGIGA